MRRNAIYEKTCCEGPGGGGVTNLIVRKIRNVFYRIYVYIYDAGLMFTLANSIAVSMYIIGFAESLLDMFQVILLIAGLEI